MKGRVTTIAESQWAQVAVVENVGGTARTGLSVRADQSVASVMLSTLGVAQLVHALLSAAPAARELLAEMDAEDAAEVPA